MGTEQDLNDNSKSSKNSKQHLGHISVDSVPISLPQVNLIGKTMRLDITLPSMSFPEIKAFNQAMGPSIQAFQSLISPSLAYDAGLTKGMQGIVDTFRAHALPSISFPEIKAFNQAMGPSIQAFQSLISPSLAYDAGLAKDMQGIVDTFRAHALPSISFPEIKAVPESFLMSQHFHTFFENSGLLENIKAITSGFRIKELPSLVDTFNYFSYVTKWENAVDAFKATGWPITLSMPSSLIEQVVMYCDLGNPKRASSIIRGYYRRGNCKNLHAMISIWWSNPHFKRYKKNIDGALRAHERREYELSIPTLMPIPEGVMKHYAPQMSTEKSYPLTKNIIDDPMVYPFRIWPIAETLKSHLLNDVYKGTPFDQQIKLPLKDREITRHTVLHGINPNYSSEGESLKYFLLLDALFAILQYQSGKLH
ncbi:MAG: hypothetical protein HY862_06305 [Chloroflexi bacterium]|nr:hypothetical protein [Chloroflexota bacterium]